MLFYEVTPMRDSELVGALDPTKEKMHKHLAGTT